MNWLPGMPVGVAGGLDRQDRQQRRALDERRDPVAVDDVHPAVGLGEEVVGDEPREGQDVREGGPVTEGGEMRRHRDAGPAHRVAALAPDRDHGNVTRVVDDVAGDEPDDVRVQRPGQRAVGGDQDDEPLAAFTLGEQRMILATEDGSQIGEDLVQLLAVRPGTPGWRPGRASASTPRRTASHG